MELKRLIELLAYAKVCFDKCTNPFETVHLAKLNVTADECRDLSAGTMKREPYIEVLEP